jgi:hypothetical protein
VKVPFVNFPPLGHHPEFLVVILSVVRTLEFRPPGLLWKCTGVMGVCCMYPDPDGEYIMGHTVARASLII